MTPAHMIATLGGVGHLRPAPGTWGSLAALPLGWGLHTLGGPWALALGITCAFFAGLWATRVETISAVEHDPSEIVVDEVVGQWIALLPASVGAAHAGVPLLALWPGLVTAFLAFRLFDIWKPWPVSRADAMATPLGVMLDDVLAGILAALTVSALAALAHGILMG